jgi:hypothetical protein
MDSLLIALLCGNLALGPSGYNQACVKGLAASSVQSGFHDDARKFQDNMTYRAQKTIGPEAAVPAILAATVLGAKNQTLGIKFTNQYAKGESKIIFGSYLNGDTRKITSTNLENRYAVLNYVDSIQLVGNENTVKLVFSWNF